MVELIDRLEAIQADIVQVLIRMVNEGGEDNRLVIQGDQGYLLVQGKAGKTEMLIKAAAGRSLERLLSEEEVKRLYESGFRRKNAALPFARTVMVEDQNGKSELALELMTLLTELYASHIDEVSLREKLGDRITLNPKRLIDAMRRLSTERDMSSRQKVYWAVIRSDVLLALSTYPAKNLIQEQGRIQWIKAGTAQISDISNSVSLRNFKDVTGYRSAAIFSDLDAFEAMDPRGLHCVRLPGRLAISLVLDQGWDSLLINPHNPVGGELYRNELVSIIEGLAKFGH